MPAPPQVPSAPEVELPCCGCTLIVTPEGILSQWLHEMHRLSGKVFLWGSFVHTSAHLLRWGIRGVRLGEGAQVLLHFRTRCKSLDTVMATQAVHSWQEA